MTKRCPVCGGDILDLPYVDGAGDFCATSCRFLAEWSEPFTPIKLTTNMPCWQCGRVMVADGWATVVKNEHGQFLCPEHTNEYRKR